MKEIAALINDAFAKDNIPFALLDEETADVRIFVAQENKACVHNSLKAAGWKEQKDTSKDVYLYGMNRFLYYTKDAVRLTVCFQLACRSTLNGQWVPLDRKINSFALKNARTGATCLVELQAEDMLCYLLAKCVYTEGSFAETDKRRIKDCLRSADRAVLMQKLEGVFFKFSDSILKMIEQDEFDSIKERLWAFSDY
jgi:hypothetical protein